MRTTNRHGHVLVTVLFLFSFLITGTAAASDPPAVATQVVFGDFRVDGTFHYLVELHNPGSSLPSSHATGFEFWERPFGGRVTSVEATSGVVRFVPPGNGWTPPFDSNTVYWDGVIPPGGKVIILITATVDSYAATWHTVFQAQGRYYYDTDGDGHANRLALTDDPGTAAVEDATMFTVQTNRGPVPDPSTIGSQFSIVGQDELRGTSLTIQDAYVTLGTAFGDRFDPRDVTRKRWGTIRLTFLSCTEAQFEWHSDGPGTANFGSGGYRVHRMLSNDATAQCESAGVTNSPNNLWVAGNWYGDARSGEGLMLDIGSDNQVFLGWFTHRPSSP